MSKDYSESFLKLLNSITAKRPRAVIQHIIEYGYITSQELKDTYGYNHPPRAVRDVREHGIPLITYVLRVQMAETLRLIDSVTLKMSSM
ncbi:MAG: hypothetical protein FWH37_00565 [Candidatus Bathyarchaeota archaeon]|nr:hypothetical protein [Candidatus Termiticorpusculum sp.]